ncbi:MAG: NAD(P)H-hydrate epimerase, partial [Clostridia bacterium]|nr:NAD(P)H-hydrate epimerase [Clostridia bacterium]
MKPILTADQMRCAENRLFAGGMESKKLMDRAASELVKRILKLLPMDGTCVIACGAGGNGGDGYAAALKLAEKGLRTVVLSVYEPKSQDAVYYRNLAKDKVFALRDVSCLEDLPQPEVWVDCLFGIGLNRKPDAIAEKLIGRINDDGRRGSAVISCDVPSGLNADTGEIPGACIIAKETVTFQCRKRGHYLGLGPEVCGKIAVADIGIPDEAIPEGAMRFVEDDDLRAVLPQRRLTAHKNDFGHLLIIAGSRGMAGAATLTAMAALRSGAGLVTVACPESILNILQALAPCAMCIGLSETDGAIDRGALKTLVSALAGKDAVAIGPGLSRRVSPDCIRLVL